MFALVLAPKSGFAAQAYAESDFDIFTRYVVSMLDNIFVFHASVFAAQAYVESDFCISSRYVL